MKAVVFGGSGFLGSHVADALSDAGYDVTVADIVPAPYLRPDQHFVECDIADAEAVLRATGASEVVYHFAGLADISECRRRPRDTVTVNVLGTVNILEAARAAGSRRFVFASSIYVAGASGSFYRVSKQACELYIEEYQREYALDYTILRFGTLFGRRADDANSVHRYLRQALEQRRIVAYGTGDELREYIHAGDAARLSVDILADEFASEQLVLTGHHPLRFRELLSLIAEIVGDDVEIELHAPGENDELANVYSGHYSITPYAFRPKLARKLVTTSYVDLGQGLVDVLHELHERQPEPAS
jgi:UDP-glucose 4-epimerase